jgi:hypothetical protein
MELGNLRKNYKLNKIKTPKAPRLIRPNQKRKIYAAGWLVFSAGSSSFKSFCRLIKTLPK